MTRQTSEVSEVSEDSGSLWEREVWPPASITAQDLGQWRGQIEWLTGRGVLERHTLGVQPIPRVTRQTGLVESRLPPRGVERIAFQRMADAGEMNPNLMGPPGQQIDFEDGRVGPTLEDSSDAARGFAEGAGSMHVPESRVSHRTNRNLNIVRVQQGHSTG